MHPQPLAELVGGALLLVVASVLAWEGIGRALGGFVRRSSARRPTVRAILDTCRILGVGIGAIAVVPYTGLASILTVLAISGLTGLVLSLPRRTTLGNGVSGILLRSDLPVRSDDGVTYGAIHRRAMRAALRNTWIATACGAIRVVGTTSRLHGPLIHHTASPQFAARYQEPAPLP